MDLELESERRQNFTTAFAELHIFINRWQERHDLRNSEIFKIMLDLMHKRAFPRDLNED